MCKICLVERVFGKTYYCDKCRSVLITKGAYRYRITPKVFVWVKGGLVKRAVVNGKDVEPLREAYEVIP